MKKIFTLLVGAAMLAPMASAEEVTMNLDSFISDGNPGALYASMKGNVTYDAASGVYSLPNFLGYPNATLEFKITDLTWDMNGTEAYSLLFLNEKATAENIIKINNNFKLDLDYSLLAGYTDGNDYTTNPVYDSGIFSGKLKVEEEYIDFKLKLSQVNAIWGNNTNLEDNALSAKRAFAVKNGDGYKFYIKIYAAGQKLDTGDGFGEFTSDPEVRYYLSFSYPEGDDTPTGITDIEAADNNAPVEYFNLQGVRVDNPANGLYIRRQGDKIEKVVIR